MGKFSVFQVLVVIGTWVFTSKDAECPNLNPTFEDTIPLKALFPRKMMKTCFLGKIAKKCLLCVTDCSLLL